jgi:hypothetical protein
MPEKEATSGGKSPITSSAQKGAGVLLVLLGLIGICTGSIWSTPAFKWLGDGLEVYPITLLLPFAPIFLIMFGARFLVKSARASAPT